MNGACKLSLSFDIAGLREDLASINKSDWRSHYKQYHYEGDWCALALQSVSGEIQDLSPGPRDAEYRPTPLLEMTPHIAELLASIKTPMRRVRLMRLVAGSEIKEHIDSYWPITDEVRLHIPIKTDDLVEFCVGGQRLKMKPGDCWYLDVNSPHGVTNRSSADRIHLVVDCEIGPWIRDLMPEPFAFEDSLWATRFMARSIRYRLRDLAERARLQNQSQLRILTQLMAKKLRNRLNTKSH